ncbi:hypothetical protein [Italian clover phyllody phytoplasma]|uniref:hypothetical protein n=1 Tax=Italian clover phyllody phytoplasma TaxID=1196420 RepID=UPI0002D8DD10|nr:hypothetical protein [Italian clover phyllody phytoplasma]
MDFANNELYKLNKNGSILNDCYQSIEIHIFETQEQLEQAFDKGVLTELSLISPYTKEKIKKYQNNDYQINYINDLNGWRMTSLYLNFGEVDPTKNITKNINFIKALFYAIDRNNKLLNDLNKCDNDKTVVYEKPTISFLPDGVFLLGNPDIIMNYTQQHKDNIRDYEYNLDKAKEFFKKVFPDNNQIIELTIIAPPQANVNDYLQIANLLKFEIEKAFDNKILIKIQTHQFRQE